MNTQTAKAKVNRLRHEKSPYLLQHANNPVDWHPWGEAAFEKARQEDKPILVSIGYSTCHWCHVMARESFSDPDTAAVMNRYFVNIKVDREERPDIDQIYISAVSAMTGSAGWPLNVFLLPDGRPFFGGTYFPPERRINPSWKEVLTAISAAYHDPEKRGEMFQSADKITAWLRDSLTGGGSAPESPPLDPETLDIAVDGISRLYDRVNGGFSDAPKFPMPPLLSFLLFYERFSAHARKESKTNGLARDMAVNSLEKMAAGGIYDHIGGGFHRYATDAAWHVPHFEKMLYDNAQLISLYTDAYEMTGRETFARVARESIEYVLRDMRHPEGAFYSAEDADSVYLDLRADRSSETGALEKSEGGFYVWQYDEIMHILQEEYEKEVFQMFAFHYGLKPEGNVKSDPLGEFAGKNIPFRARSIGQTAGRFGREEDETGCLLEKAAQTLFAARKRRPRPHLDDKILVEWNGLMISALASAFRVFGDKRYLDAAEAAVSFIYERMVENEPDPELFRRWRDGERNIPGMAADYAFLMQGLIDLWEAGFDALHLWRAERLARRMLGLFYDEGRGGFFTTADGRDRHLLMRTKDAVDNVMPSVDAVTARNLMRLYRFTGSDPYFRAAERTMNAAMNRMEKQPSAVPSMLSVLGMRMLRHAETVVVGRFDTQKAGAVRNVLRSFPREALSPVWIETGKNRDLLGEIMPHVREMQHPDTDPAIFVCFDRTCRNPLSGPEELRKTLNRVFASPLEEHGPKQ